jgi:hypothetical protein
MCSGYQIFREYLCLLKVAVQHEEGPTVHPSVDYEIRRQSPMPAYP